jgi:excisionase family DNA binding protein
VKRFDARRAKIHRTYAVEEAARVLGSHKNTVRNWLRDGLEAIDRRRPILIRGAELKAYLNIRRSRHRSPCGPGQIYCLRCRSPKHPMSAIAEYLPITTTSGNLRACCPDCLGRIFRRVSLPRLAAATGNLTITFPHAQQRIVESVDPSLNCDLERVPDAQRGK